MKKPPDRLKQYENQLTFMIRQTQHINSPLPGISLPVNEYRGFIRGNINSVIKHTFPVFDSTIDSDEKHHFIDSFLEKHTTLEPEFHHIATEFVRFMQQQCTLERRLQCVLEYEWVLFYSEIRPEQVPDSTKPPMMMELNHSGLVIALNPTLQVVELPFSVEGDRIHFSHHPESNTCFFYGIYRSQDHRVYSKNLTPLEKWLIDLINQPSSIALSEFVQTACQQVSLKNLSEWIAESCNSNLLTLSEQE